MNGLEKELVRTLKKLNRPVSTDTLSIMTGKPRWDVHEKLVSLSKYKKIRKVTSQKVDFWR